MLPPRHTTAALALFAIMVTLAPKWVHAQADLAPLGPTRTDSSTTTVGGCGNDGDCPQDWQCNIVRNNRGVCQPRPAAQTPVAPPQDLPFTPTKPTLQFTPPTLQFSDIQVKDIGEGTRAVDIPWIGQYLAAVYRYAVPVGAMLAVLVIMIAGLIYLTSAGTDRIATAKQWIGNAVVGLVILVSSYLILRFLNPELTEFTQLRVKLIEREELPTESEPDFVTGSESTDLVRTEGENIVGTTPIDRGLLEKVQKAALALQSQNITLKITSSYRTVEQQKAQIADKCQNPPGSQTCNPKPGKPPACILRGGAASCPHTTGRAVDAWGLQDGVQCVSQKTGCIGAGVDACRRNPCQAAVIKALKDQGFCNWQPEPWHFEQPPMSPNCN